MSCNDIGGTLVSVAEAHLISPWDTLIPAFFGQCRPCETGDGGAFPTCKHLGDANA
jgi:hypothetical protein